MTRPVEEWMVCAVCGRVLERLDRREWLHPTDMRLAGESHAPVPVPRAEAERITEVCDFCFAPNPPWELPTRNFPMPYGAQMDVSTSGWACCDLCADLIRRDMWTQLTNRAINSYANRHQGEPMSPRQETYLRRMYRLVRRNVVGPVHPNDPRKDKDYGDGVGEVEAEDVTVTAPVHWSGEGGRRGVV